MNSIRGKRYFLLTIGKKRGISYIDTVLYLDKGVYVKD